MAKIQSCRNKCGTFIYVALHEGKWKPFDSQTNQLHDCPNSPYNQQNQNQNGQQQQQETYKVTSPQQQIPAVRLSTNSPAFEHTQQKPVDFVPGDIMATLHIVEKLDAKMDNLNIAVAKVMSLVQTINDGINAYLNEPTVVENRILKAKVNELQALVADREDNFVPANKVPVQNKATALGEEDESQTEHDQHVRDMIEKGRQANEEELDLT